LNGDVGNDELQGGNGKDTLIGGEGDDTLNGGAGDDTLYMEEGEDLAYGGDGIDTAYILGELADYSVYTYSALPPVSASISPTSASMSAAKFTQLIDKNGKTVNFTGVEKLVFSVGAQTVAADSLLKNAGTDKKDTINGGAVADFIFAGAGDDKVNGKEGADQIDGGTGKDTLDGGAGNDRLDGGLGDDTLIGGLGDDTYVVDSAKDKLTEKASQGLDTVISTVNYTLANNVENLSLVGFFAYNGTGNALANTIIGNAADNVLNGGLGNDTLTGGGGKDTFLFNSKLGGNVDNITDFGAGDKIALDDAIFSKLKGQNASEHFYVQRIVGVSAQDSDDYLFYDFESGQLYYDADGSGIKAAVLIATVGSATELSANDFVVV
jgi:Ca2+-binding RTX toxin-like protein